MPRNYLCGAQSSPFRKFTDTPEGVGHRHKLPKLVEESNILSIRNLRDTPTVTEPTVVCYSHPNNRIWEGLSSNVKNPTKYVLEER